jgi:hypothetical protein
VHSQQRRIAFSSGFFHCFLTFTFFIITVNEAYHSPQRFPSQALLASIKGHCNSQNCSQTASKSYRFCSSGDSSNYSDWFGIRASFGLRPAGFGFPGRPALTGQSIETGLEIAFAPQSHQLFGHLSLLKKQQRWNRANPVLRR